MSDADVTTTLLSRAQQGDREALVAVLEQIAPSIHRFGRRLCKNETDADDVLQDTLLSVAEHLQEFEGRSSFTSWVFALTRSACTRRRRGQKNRPAEGDEVLVAHADQGKSPEAQALEGELAAALTHALEALPEEYREVLVLRDFEGLSAAEAAETLGVSVDALKSRLHRARAALRLALRPVLEPSLAGERGACPNVAELWSQKLEGELSQQDCAAMEKHLEACPSCGAACMALKKTLFACQQTRTNSVPLEVQQRVKDALKVWAQPSGQR